MATYQIVCTNKSDSGHGHITHAGTGDFTGYSQRWTVAEVRAAIRAGSVFYTVSPSRPTEVALVEPYDCSCGVKTIRTDPDEVTDNNLDNLQDCAY
jgi:uncharacterized protein DUF3892